MITSLDKNTALVLIDLQKGIMKRESAHPIKKVLERACFLADAFRQAGLPVVVVNVNPVGAAWTKVRAEKKPFVPQSKAGQTAAKVVISMVDFTEIVPEVHTQPDDIQITKKTWNAFFDTKLHDELQKRQVTGIVIGGVSTSIGVEGTARAASELGYNISFATDAMTDSLLEAHQHSIKNIFPRIGETGTVQEIIEKLSADSPGE